MKLNLYIWLFIFSIPVMFSGCSDSSVPDNNPINDLTAVPYLLENASILDAYLLFDNWVEKPSDYENWYLDLPGYRNADFLCFPPGE